MAVFLEPIKSGQRIPLDKAVVFFGRHPDCDVVLTRSKKVSRRHCCFAHVNSSLMVRDLGSMNGVRVNGKRISKEAVLSVGDEISLGDVAYRLSTQNGKKIAEQPHEPLPAADAESHPESAVDAVADPVPQGELSEGDSAAIRIPDDYEIDMSLPEDRSSTPDSMSLMSLTNEEGEQAQPGKDQFGKLFVDDDESDDSESDSEPL